MICKNCGAELPDTSGYCFSCGEFQSLEHTSGFTPIIVKDQIKEQIVMLFTMIMTALFLIAGVFKFSFAYAKLDVGSRPLYLSISMDNAAEQLVGMGIDDFSDRNDKWSEVSTYIAVGASLISLIILCAAIILVIMRKFDKAASAVGVSILSLPAAHISNFLYFIHLRSDSIDSSFVVFSALPFVMTALDILTAVMCFRVSRKTYHISSGDKFDSGSILEKIPYFVLCNAFFISIGVICFSYNYQKQYLDYKVSNDLFNDYTAIYYLGIKKFLDSIENDFQKSVLIINFIVTAISLTLCVIAVLFFCLKRKTDALRLVVVSALLPIIGYALNIALRGSLNDDLRKSFDERYIIGGYDEYKYLFSPVPAVMICVCIAAAAVAVYTVRSLKHETGSEEEFVEDCIVQ